MTHPPARILQAGRPNSLLMKRTSPATPACQQAMATTDHPHDLEALDGRMAVFIV